MARENDFYRSHVRHLPSISLDEVGQRRGQVIHVVVFHDSWCAHYSGGECNCSPHFELREEPVRS